MDINIPVADHPGEQPDTIVHCSDLHFGSGYRPELGEDLVEQINEVNPDLVVVSGDLTMRARSEQFEAARKLLLQFNAPLLVIPGNHDVPLYAFWDRAMHPFDNYRRFIEDLNAGPIRLKNVALFGMNTVNPWRHQQGKIRLRELAELERWMADVPGETWKLAVVHQQFADIPRHERPGIYPHAEARLRRISEAGVHAVLHGHVHYHHVASSAEFYPGIQRPVVLVCAGTPTSLRTRGATLSNNFNILKFYKQNFEVHQCNWTDDQLGFEVGPCVSFDRSFYSPALP